MGTNESMTSQLRYLPFGTGLLAAGLDLLWVPFLGGLAVFLSSVVPWLEGRDTALVALAFVLALATLPGQRLLGIGQVGADGGTVSHGRRLLRHLLRLVGIAAGCVAVFLVWGIATLGFPKDPKALVTLGILTIPVLVANGALAVRRRPLLHDLLCRTRPVLLRCDPRWDGEHVQLAVRVLALWLDLGLLSLCLRLTGTHLVACILVPALAVAVNRFLPGRRLAGVRIVNRQGQQLSYGAGLVREALRLSSGALQTWIPWSLGSLLHAPWQVLNPLLHPKRHPEYWADHRLSVVAAVTGVGLLAFHLIQGLRGRPLLHDLILGTRPRWILPGASFWQRLRRMISLAG